MKNNILKLKTAWLPVIAGILSSMALCVNVAFEADKSFKDMFVQEVNGIGITGLVVFIAVMFLYLKSWKLFLERSKFITHLLAFILSAFMMIGLSYSKLGNWDFIFGNARQFVIACVFFIGFFILFDVCISLLYGADFTKIKEKLSYKPKHIPAFISNHYFLFAFGVIAVCWLPYVIFNLPGSVPHDGYYQINMAFGINEITNHHPWVLTEFYGLLMAIGRKISDNFGVFLIVAVSFVVEAYCYAKVCEKIRSWSAPFLLNALTLAFFAVLPVFGAYAQAVIKDGIFTALFALFMAHYIDLCIHYIRKKKIDGYYKKIIALFVVGLLVCLTRNNGVYMVVPACILLLFFSEKKKKIFAVLLTVCIISGYFVIENPLASALNVQDGSIKEMLSIPFQQTARYIQEYPDEVTEEEKEAINNVLSYSTISQKYNPELSDPVKNTFRANSTNEDLLNYFKVWFKMFQKHPGVYFEATFHNTFGYYYPFYNCDVMGPYQFNIMVAPVATGDFDIHYVVPENVRKIIYAYSDFWREVPGAGQIVNPGTYTWILLICIGYLCYKKNFKGILVTAAPFLNVMVCIASPVNGLLRYAMPLMACTPMIIYWCLSYKNRTKYKSKKLADENNNTDEPGLIAQ